MTVFDTLHSRAQRGIGALVAALFLGALAFGCSDTPSSSPSRSTSTDSDEASTQPDGNPASTATPSIVLISIDTLRADRLPAWGYAEIATPAIDSLVRDGVRFARAYSQAPMTLPSHASLMTGLWPMSHGVRDNMGYSLDAQRLPLLAARLADAGYDTAGLVSSFVLRRDTGMGHGFDAYDDDMPFVAGSGQKGLQRAGSETVTAALRWIDERQTMLSGQPGAIGDARPFFLFLHLFEPHTPYDPPEPFRSRYASPYDGEVATADAAVAMLLDGLRGRGLYDAAAIVLLSDHGESLGEHGEDEHGIFVYPSTLHIPMILKLPGGAFANTAVEQPVQLVDVAPTLLELVGIEAAAKTPDGRSMMPLVRGEAVEPRTVYAETYYPRLYFGWSELRTIIEGPRQLVMSPEPELFDLAQDPAAEHNLVRQERREFARLRDRLEQMPAQFENPVEVDADTRAQLVSLGYVGGARSADRGELPSPASQIHLLGRLREAFLAASRGEMDKAAAVYSEIVTENPKMMIAWEQLARALAKSGRLDEAAEAYSQALEISSGSPHLALAAAGVELSRGQLATADALAQAAVAHDPAAAYGLRARIAIAGGKAEAAEQHARALLDLDPESLQAVVMLAQVDRMRGDPQAALQRLEQARPLADARPMADFFLQRADLLARLGNSEAAVGAFEEAIRRFPKDPRSYQGLALLHATLGDGQASYGALDRWLEALPRPESYAAAIGFLRTLGDTQAAERRLQEARKRFPTDPRFHDKRP